MKWPWLIFLECLVIMSCRSNPDDITRSDVRAAQEILHVHFADDKIDTLLPYLQRNRSGYDSLRKYPLDNEVFPALLFNMLPKGFTIPTGADTLTLSDIGMVKIPDDREELCWYSIAELGYLLRNRLITSTELTQIFLTRIARLDNTLKAVISMTDEIAYLQAKRADEEIAKGRYRGPLHGIPYGVKDLAAVPGYPTTWGSAPYQDQKIEYKATVVQKLEDAGAILIAKLSSGALARGDVWFGGKTVSPWDTTMGASGSSAGSGSATAAGLVAFSLGTETLGSITSPSARNGVTGLRPTYGTVSRYGVMTLAWSMDKIGPICRSAQDCALVYAAIHGRDTLDMTTYQHPVVYDAEQNMTNLRIGYLKEAFEADTTVHRINLDTVLALLQAQNATLIPKRLPTRFPFKAFDIILRAEAGAFFDSLIRSDKIDSMVQQDRRSRANSLRQARFIPAVEYLQANRHRNRLIEEMNTLMADIDILITPPNAKNQLLTTNLTGHPALVLPTGLDSLQHPTSITVIGSLFDEGTLLEFGHHYQRLTNHHQKRPPYADHYNSQQD